MEEGRLQKEKTRRAWVCMEDFPSQISNDRELVTGSWEESDMESGRKHGLVWPWPVSGTADCLFYCCHIKTIVTWCMCRELQCFNQVLPWLNPSILFSLPFMSMAHNLLTVWCVMALYLPVKACISCQSTLFWKLSTKWY